MAPLRRGTACTPANALPSTHRGPPAAEIPRRHPPRGVAGAVAGGLGPVAAHGAHGRSRRRRAHCKSPISPTGAGTSTACASPSGACAPCSSASAPSPPSPSTPRSARPTPAVVKACIDSGWELNAHSYEQIPMHKVEDQRAVIAKTMSVIEKFSGKRPRGWFGPGPDADLRHARLPGRGGVEYIGDYVLDDDPVTLKTKHGPVVALPYTFEVHDIVMMNLQHHDSEEFHARAMDHFRCLYAEFGRSGPRSWPSPATRICRACRTASPTWSAPSPTSSATTASWPGPASRFWIGTRRNSCHAGTCSRHPSINKRRSQQRVGFRRQAPG